ncbi:MAG: hypothetical protein A2W99_04765 [Bacteroidetes bacterium GWF2_33_16]|nr:MAG: hypothetical protein A2X00_17285 [Bacteroidetes bacterium GWE2_32_14]OFY05981.1 MAG: hypothetical protein A2W99_04765 [Bacteroidetes bacterium GWF2_33_16]
MIDSKVNTDFLSIIIPVYNDYEVLDELYNRLVQVIPELCNKYEIILIDDGSKDNSWSKIKELKNKNGNIVGIKLIRNFGQHNAISAGLNNVSGDLVVLMDSDLQDKPEDISKLIDALIQNDSSMCIAKWKSRKDTFSKKLVSRLFHIITTRITKLRHEPNLGVFRVIRKELVNELAKYNEKTATSLSLLYWIGADYVTVDLDRDERFAGKSGYSIRKMIKLTLDRIFSFSMFPIRLAIFSGISISLISFVIAIVLIIKRLNGIVAPGWTSLAVLILFLFGLTFLFLGVIGEYLGRIFLESKQRPNYIIKKILK